jgi:hypothetical protein
MPESLTLSISVDYNFAIRPLKKFSPNKAVREEWQVDILNRNSLAETLDNLNDAFFWSTPVPTKDALATSHWIASRQGLPGSYYGLFAPTPHDLTYPLNFFSGEMVNSRASRAHILGEEASCALLRLKIPVLDIQTVWQRANQSLLEKIHEYESQDSPAGHYCCGNCTTAFWRNLVAGGLDQPEARLKAGLKGLKKLRKNDGAWRTFPFYQTLFTLLEIDLKAAREELRYAAPVLESKLKRLKSQEKYALRRKAIAERVLAAV